MKRYGPPRWAEFWEAEAFCQWRHTGHHYNAAPNLCHSLVRLFDSSTSVQAGLQAPRQTLSINRDANRRIRVWQKRWEVRQCKCRLSDRLHGRDHWCFKSELPCYISFDKPAWRQSEQTSQPVSPSGPHHTEPLRLPWMSCPIWVHTDSKRGTSSHMWQNLLQSHHFLC